MRAIKRVRADYGKVLDELQTRLGVTPDRVAGSSTPQSISSPRGGGAMDALFLVLLASLAFAAALRRRSARPHLSTPPR